MHQLVPTEKIWLPGQGVVDLEPMRVHRAVQAYDERLMFGRNEANGDWCIFVKMPHGEIPLPVLGFGDTIPTPEEAVRRADAANTRRHSTQILDRIMKEDEDRRAANARERERLAELYADIMKEARGIKGPQIFVPRSL